MRSKATLFCNNKTEKEVKPSKFEKFKEGCRNYALDCFDGLHHYYGAKSKPYAMDPLTSSANCIAGLYYYHQTVVAEREEFKREYESNHISTIYP